MLCWSSCRRQKGLLWSNPTLLWNRSSVQITNFHWKITSETLWETWHSEWLTNACVLVTNLVKLNFSKIGIRRSSSPHWNGDGWSGCQHEAFVGKQQWKAEVLFHTCLASRPETDGLRPPYLPGRESPQKKPACDSQFILNLFEIKNFFILNFLFSSL